MHHFKLYENGNIFGKIYTFPKRGLGLAMHSHQADSYHNVIILSGSAEIYGPNKEWSQIATAGQIIDFPDERYQTHEIAALEDNTVIINIYLNGRSAFDDDCGRRIKIPLPPGMQHDPPPKEGWVDHPITIPLDPTPSAIVI